MGTPIAGLSPAANLPRRPAEPERQPLATPSGKTLEFRRIFILPTRQGVSFALLLTVMLLGAINYDNALGYVLCFLLGAVSLVSMLHACRNLSGLSVRSGDTAAVFAGETAHFTILLDNRGQGRKFSLVARWGREARKSAEREPVVHVCLEANAVRRVELPLPAERRGWYRPGRVTIASRFPFGLFRAWSNVDAGVRCLVYPRPAGSSVLPPSHDQDSTESGHGGRGRDDFSGLRDYVPGDSPRQIHWKAVAREQGVPVKQFAGGSAGTLWLRWQDIPADDTESRLSQLCRWVLEADARGFRYGLALPGNEIAPEAGDLHLHACLKALALYPAEAKGR